MNIASYMVHVSICMFFFNVFKVYDRHYWCLHPHFTSCTCNKRILYGSILVESRLSFRWKVCASVRGHGGGPEHCRIYVRRVSSMLYCDTPGSASFHLWHSENHKVSAVGWKLCFWTYDISSQECWTGRCNLMPGAAGGAPLSLSLSGWRSTLEHKPPLHRHSEGGLLESCLSTLTPCNRAYSCNLKHKVNSSRHSRHFYTCAHAQFPCSSC